MTRLEMQYADSFDSTSPTPEPARLSVPSRRIRHHRGFHPSAESPLCGVPKLSAPKGHDLAHCCHPLRQRNPSTKISSRAGNDVRGHTVKFHGTESSYAPARIMYCVSGSFIDGIEIQPLHSAVPNGFDSNANLATRKGIHPLGQSSITPKPCLLIGRLPSQSETDPIG